MDCKELQPLLMGYLDDEIDEPDREVVRLHLVGCPPCRREEAAFRRLNRLTGGIEFVEPTEAEWKKHWQGVYNRLERGAAWIFLSLGAVVLLLYGAWRLFEDFLLDPEQDLALRLGVGALSAGVVVLGVSVVRERMRVYRVDRYEEVEL